MDRVWWFLKFILLDWVVALFRACRRLCRWCKRRGRDLPPAPDRHCFPIAEPSFLRPDPTIYDQYWLTNLGVAVTWDNPDIQLYRGGTPVDSANLEAGVSYMITARVWNNSTEAPVIDLPVRFSFLEFGIGTTSHPVGVTAIPVLGVQGGPDHPAFATMPWTTPTTPGHYCIQVGLEPVDDTNLDNNLGQENTNVGVAHSPAVFDFTLANVDTKTHRYRFEVDAYVLGDRSSCDKAPAERLDRHRRAHHPLPAGWAVAISPEAPSLDPSATTNISVTVEPPPGWSGTQAVNVNAFNPNQLAGGVTLIVKR